MCLKRLCVSRNGLGDKGCGAAGTALVHNRTLLELDLSGTRAMNQGFLALALGLPRNEGLHVLKVSVVRSLLIESP